jgi:hypothetical protein
MYSRKQSSGPALLASLVAGPIYVVSFALSEYCRQIPQSVSITFESAPFVVVTLVFSVIGGFFLSILPNLLGAGMMAHAADASESAQSPLAWVGAGAVIGALIALPFSWIGERIDPLTMFPLVATSAACAGLCWRLMGWSREPLNQG